MTGTTSCVPLETTFPRLVISTLRRRAPSVSLVTITCARVASAGTREIRWQCCALRPKNTLGTMGSTVFVPAFGAVELSPKASTAAAIRITPAAPATRRCLTT